jgi:hypothetical protein
MLFISHHMKRVFSPAGAAAGVYSPALGIENSAPLLDEHFKTPSTRNLRARSQKRRASMTSINGGGAELKRGKAMA